MNDSEIARSRWKLLSAVIKGQKSYTCNKNADGSPLWSFIGALFRTRDISCDLKAEFTDSANCQHIRWLEYNPVTEFAVQEDTKTDDTRKQSIPSNSLQLRVYTSLTDQTSVVKTDPVKHRLNTLSGFDNTGNVHIWSSELLLAHAILCVSIYPGLSRFLSERFAPGSCQRICEVGAGMTGAAGLATCMIRMQPESVFHPLYVLLTDGNERCVESLQANLEHHVARFKPLLKTSFHMEARRITWKMDNEMESCNPDPSLLHSFDLVLAADCFFNPAGHRGLIQLIDSLLSDSRRSLFLAIAPWRGSTLKQFLHLVADEFPQWTVTCLEPNSYMHPSLYQTLISGLACTPVEVITDKIIGQLILMERAA